jgi:hypothetical protein
MHTQSSSGNLKGTGQYEDLGVDGKIISERIWLWKGTSGGCCERGNEAFEFHKRRGLAE